MYSGNALGVGLAVVGLWPGLALVSSWHRYTNPWIALAVYVGSLVLVGTLWWRGPAGIGRALSLGGGLALAAGNLALITQLPPGQPPGAALWLHSWGIAVPLVLVLCRPVVEPVAILALLTATNVVAGLRSGTGVIGAHETAIHVGIGLVVSSTALALALALRHTITTTRRMQHAVRELERREHVARSIARDREERLTCWAARIMPVLEDVVEGRRSVRDETLIADSHALARSVRAELDADTESILEPLIPRAPGIELTIRDLGVGHRLDESDRVELVRLVRSVLSDGATGRLHLSLVAADDEAALVVVTGDGLRPPAPHGRGTLTTGEGSRWWYDATLRLAGTASRGGQYSPR